MPPTPPVAWSTTQKTNLTAVETAISTALSTCGSVNDPWQQGVRHALLECLRLIGQVKVERGQ